MIKKSFALLFMFSLMLAACGTINVSMEQPAPINTPFELSPSATAATDLPVVNSVALPPLPLGSLPPVVAGTSIQQGNAGMNLLPADSLPASTHFDDASCGIGFDHPADWEVMAVPGASCLFGLRPAVWADFVQQSTAHEEEYALYVTASLEEWSLMAARAGFVQDGTQPGLVGRQGIVLQAQWTLVANRAVLYGEAPRGLYSKSDGGYIGLGMSRAAIISLGESATGYLRSAYALPAYWPAFQMVMTSLSHKAPPPGTLTWEIKNYSKMFHFSYPPELYSVIDGPSNVNALWPGVIEIAPNDQFNQFLNQPSAATWRIRVAIQENKGGWTMNNAPALLSGAGLLIQYSLDLFDAQHPIQPYAFGDVSAWRVNHLTAGQSGDATHIIAIHNGRVFEWLIEPQQVGDDMRNWQYVEAILATFSLK